MPSRGKKGQSIVTPAKAGPWLGELFGEGYRTMAWRMADLKPRWVAAALLDIGPRLRRIEGHRALPRLGAVMAPKRCGFSSGSQPWSR